MHEIWFFFAKVFFMNRFMPILNRFKRRVGSDLNRFKTFRWIGSHPRLCEPVLIAPYPAFKPVRNRHESVHKAYLCKEKTCFHAFIQTTFRTGSTRIFFGVISAPTAILIARYSAETMKATAIPKITSLATILYIRNCANTGNLKPRVK